MKLEVIWQEHELGLYPVIGLTWEDPFRGVPSNYVSRCEAALAAYENGGELPPGWTMPPVRDGRDIRRIPYANIVILPMKSKRLIEQLLLLRKFHPVRIRLFERKRNFKQVRLLRIPGMCLRDCLPKQRRYLASLPRRSDVWISLGKLRIYANLQQSLDRVLVHTLGSHVAPSIVQLG